MTTILLVGLALMLVVVSISLAAVEAAFYLMKRRRLSHLAVANPRAELVNHYLEDPPTLLMPVHIGTYTAHVAITVIITAVFLEHLQQWAMLLAFSVMVLYLLLLRLTLPYALVRRNPERSLLVLLPFFHVYARALSPLVRALRRRAAPDLPPPEPEEGGLSVSAVPEVPPAPVHDLNEDRLVDAVARFAATHVRDVMTPRPDIVALSSAATVADLRRVMRETKYSRVPIYGENLDDIVGVVTVRDLLEFDGADEDSIQALARPASLVPETKKIAELLKEFQTRRLTCAVVIDEYGGTAGLVTVEDIVEEIVGEIKDEYDMEAEPIAVEPDGAVLVAGRVNVDRLEQALESSLANGQDVDTVGGLVSTAFGRIPRTGERIDYKGFTIEVVSAEHKRVNRVRIRRKPEAAESA